MPEMIWIKTSLKSETLDENGDGIKRSFSHVKQDPTKDELNKFQKLVVKLSGNADSCIQVTQTKDLETDEIEDEA